MSPSLLTDTTTEFSLPTTLRQSSVGDVVPTRDLSSSSVFDKAVSFRDSATVCHLDERQEPELKRRDAAVQTEPVPVSSLDSSGTEPSRPANNVLEEETRRLPSGSRSVATSTFTPERRDVGTHWDSLEQCTTSISACPQVESRSVLHVPTGSTKSGPARGADEAAIDMAAGSRSEGAVDRLSAPEGATDALRARIGRVCCLCPSTPSVLHL